MGQPGDGELLRRFSNDGDHDAFETLVARHSGVVFRAARSVLGDDAAAEDVMQATFLTLTRKAGALSGDRPLGGWLHYVAVRLARDERRKAVRRRAREQAAVRASHAEQTTDASRAEERAQTEQQLSAMHEELARLSSKDRASVVLHHLEGKSYADAAVELGCSTDAFGMRLSRARERLRRRLSRRGAGVSAGALTAMLSSQVIAAPSASGVRAAQAVAGAASSAKAAEGMIVSEKVLTMTQGAMHMLMMAKLKATAAVFATILAVGAAAPLGWMAAARAADGPKPERAKSIQADDRAVVSLAVSPNGRTIVTGGAATQKGLARLWTTEGRPVRTLADYERPMSNVAFSPDGKSIAHPSGDADNGFSVTLTPVSGGKGRAIGSFQSPVKAFDFSPDGKHLAIAARGRLTVWRAADGKMVHDRSMTSVKGAPESFYAIAYSPDGSKIAAGTFWSTLYIVDADTGKTLASTVDAPGKTAIQAVAFTPDGKQVLAGSVRLSDDGALKVYDADSLEERGSFGAIRCAAISIHDGLVAAAHSPARGAGEVRLYDLASRKQQHTLGLKPAGAGVRESSGSGAAAVAFHPSGRLLYAGDHAGRLTIWRMPQ